MNSSERKEMAKVAFAAACGARAITAAQKQMLATEPKIMDLRPEAGPVIPIYGSAQHRTAHALADKGLVKVFYLAPYDNAFIRIL